MPFPDFDELAANIPLYRKNGVVGIFLEGDFADGGGGENAELRSYVMARLLWNPSMDVNKTINEFMAAYYGKAARPMRAYLDLLQQQVRPEPQGKGQSMWIYSSLGSSYLSPELLAQADKFFHEAETADLDEATKARVAKARLSITYVKLMHAKAFEVGNGSYAPAARFPATELPQLHKRRPFFRHHRTSRGCAPPRRRGELPALHEALPSGDHRERGAARSVAPELNGRIIRIIDKKSGKDLLHRPDPGDDSIRTWRG